MKVYKFEVQNNITIKVFGANSAIARQDLIDNLSSYAFDMIDDCIISDGEEVDTDATQDDNTPTGI